MKNVFLVLIAVLSMSAVQAHPRRPHCPPRIHHHHHRSHHHREIAAGVVGGAILGGLLFNRVSPGPVVVNTAPVVVTPAPVVVQPPVVVTPAPVVVQQPVYQTQNVWVEGRYVDTVQPNGITVRTWQPGHYEQRTVQVQ